MNSKFIPHCVILALFYTVAGYAGINEANLAYAKGDYSAALQDVRPLAEKGKAAAQNLLGVMYYNGKGVRQDKAQGIAWYRKAAEQGNPDAQNNLGTAYVFGGGVPLDYSQAAAWFYKAAEQGHASAEFNLGYLYQNGQGVPQDFTQAAKWYRKAAEQGDIYAQNNLGNLYKNGKGVPQDHNQAIAWYRKAAEQGYATAQAMLGYIYSTGQGVPIDNVQAVNWYRKAAAQGNVAAQDNLRIVKKELTIIELEAIAKEQIEKIEAQGYKFMSFANFELDAKSIPSGTRLAISGIYQAEGQMEKLAENMLPNALSIILITDSASRPTRERFLDCRGIGRFCAMTLVGYTNKCNVTWLGSHVSTNVCLVVEKNWELEERL